MTKRLSASFNFVLVPCAVYEPSIYRAFCTSGSPLSLFLCRLWLGLSWWATEVGKVLLLQLTWDVIPLCFRRRSFSFYTSALLVLACSLEARTSWHYALPLDPNLIITLCTYMLNSIKKIRTGNSVHGLQNHGRRTLTPAYIFLSILICRKELGRSSPVSIFNANGILGVRTPFPKSRPCILS